jgi:hypothetical protein
MKISNTLFNAGQNFARPTKYSAIITTPPIITTFIGNELNVLCKSINMPPINNEVYELKVKGHPVKLPKRTIQNQEITITFYVDEGYRVKKIFQDWIEILDDRFNVPGINEFPDTLPIEEKYGFLTLIPQNFYETPHAPIKMSFENVFPISVGDLTFDGSDKDSTQQLTVSFGYYRYFTTLH